MSLANVKCDSKSSLCLFDILEKDGDKHPPPACGGDDCDDSASTIHPGMKELCDGQDNDCDDKVAVGATCATLMVCETGRFDIGRRVRHAR